MAAQNAQSKYADVSTTAPQRGGNWIRPGHYLARVDSLEEGVTFKHEPYVAAQLTILHTYEDSQPGRDYGRKIDLPLHRPGDEVVDVMKRQNVAFAQRLKAFIMAAGSFAMEDFATKEGAGKIEEFPGQIIDEAVSEAQPLAGKVVEFVAETIPNKTARTAKTEDQFGARDVFTKITYRRQVPNQEVIETVAPNILARLMPDLVRA